MSEFVVELPERLLVALGEVAWADARAHRARLGWAEAVRRLELYVAKGRLSRLLPCRALRRWHLNPRVCFWCVKLRYLVSYQRLPWWGYREHLRAWNSEQGRC